MDAMEDANAYMAIIKENIEYDHHMKYGRWQDKGFKMQTLIILTIIKLTRTILI